MVSNFPAGKILIVDDERNITDLLAYNLGSEGFGVDVEPVAADVVISDIGLYRMVIADAMQQEFNGLDLCNAIKSNRQVENTPIIICSAREDEDLMIDALDTGADDFVAKPFSLRELVARIRAVLRRHPVNDFKAQRQASHEINVPGINLTIDVDAQKVTSEGVIVPLTKTEYAILVFLVKNRNSFFTRDQICENVWKEDASGNVRIVDTNISRLRKKLGDNGKYVINRYGLGYAFVEKLS